VDYLMLLLYGEHCLDLMYNVTVLLAHVTGHRRHYRWY
jgi:hypothetical protein